MATWHTPSTARDLWDDAPVDDDELGELLDIAKQAVLAYAPSIDFEDTAIPPAWRRVQLEHARNVYRAMYTDRSGLDDLDGFGSPVRYRNLDASLRELLRPRTVFGGPVG